jgi:hypothetical protein
MRPDDDLPLDAQDDPDYEPPPDLDVNEIEDDRLEPVDVPEAEET